MKYSTQEEIWKDVEGYEGRYQVSTFGNVRSVDRYQVNKRGNEAFYKGKSIATREHKGYWLVNLSKNSKIKTYTLSRLIAKTFIPNDDPAEKIEVNHIDEDKSNNSVCNLEWVTPKQNSNHGTRNKRISNHPRTISMKKRVMQIDSETGKIIKEYESVSQAQKELTGNLNHGGLFNYLRGTAKTFCGYDWELV